MDLDFNVHHATVFFAQMQQHLSGQIIATSHEFSPQKVAKKGKSPYFREIKVGEIP